MTPQEQRAMDEAHAAMRYVLGMLSAIGPDKPIGNKLLSDIRTRLQNALDGLPTRLGGEPEIGR